MGMEYDMKPSPELISKWRAESFELANKQTSNPKEFAEIVDSHFAELAAQWGAEQSQDAKRYRFITSDACDARKAVDEEHRECIYYVWQLLARENPIPTKEAIDAAIDAAMQGDNHE